MGDPWPSVRLPTARERAGLHAMLEADLIGTSPGSLAALADGARIRRARADETMFRQGEPVSMSLLTHGHGLFRRTTAHGQQVTVAIAYPGEVVGLTGISSTIAAVDMVALTDGEVATWRGADVRRLAATDPEFALVVIDRMARFLAAMTERVDGFLHQDARRRVVRVLARYRELFFAEPPVLSRAHLPGLVGTSREMTGRVVRDLEREGTIVRVGRTGLRLLRPDRLVDDPEPPVGATA